MNLHYLKKKNIDFYFFYILQNQFQKLLPKNLFLEWRRQSSNFNCLYYPSLGKPHLNRRQRLISEISPFISTQILSDKTFPSQNHILLPAIISSESSKVYPHPEMDATATSAFPKGGKWHPLGVNPIIGFVVPLTWWSFCLCDWKNRHDENDATGASSGNATSIRWKKMRRGLMGWAFVNGKLKIVIYFATVCPRILRPL